MIVARVTTCLLLSATTAFAQAPTAADTLRVTVVDPSGAVVVDATVTMTSAEEATRASTPAPARASGNGVATFTGLTPGRYMIQAEFPGFETRVLKDVRVRDGENKQVAVLTIQK